MSESEEGGLRSGQLARAAGISPDTLRYYERCGLIARPKRLRNGYRSYAPEMLVRVRLIQRALSVGFSIDELTRVLRSRDRGQPPCHEVRALAERKLQEVEGHLEEMVVFRDSLREILRDWNARLSKQMGRDPALLLETLTFQPGEIGKTLRGTRFDSRSRRKESK